MDAACLALILTSRATQRKATFAVEWHPYQKILAP